MPGDDHLVDDFLSIDGVGERFSQIDVIERERFGIETDECGRRARDD